MDKMEQHTLLEAIGKLALTVTALQGDMKGMGAAIAQIQASQGSHGAQTTNSVAAPEEGKAADLGLAEELEPGHFENLVGSLPGDFTTASPDRLLLSEVGDEAAHDLVTSLKAELASAPVEAFKMEETMSDPGQAKEEASGIEAALVEDASTSSLEEAVPIEEVAILSDEGDEDVPGNVEASRGELEGCLADRLTSAADMMENALPELRMMMDRLRFVSVDPEQQEQLTIVMAAVKEEVTTLAAMALEIREEVRIGREALASMQSAGTDSTFPDDGLAELNEALTRGLDQLAREAKENHETTLNALSMGNAALGNYLDAELAKFHAPIAALQESVGQVANAVSRFFSGLRPKILQTWGASLFGLTVVILYILIRSFWG